MDSSDENRMVIILIHLGLEHKTTKRLLKKIDPKILSVITKIKLRDDLKGWLQCNSKDVVVKSYPSFLVTVNGNTTVYSESEYQKVVDIITELLEE